MLQYSLNNISDFVSGKFFGCSDNCFVKIITDSRKISQFNETLFVAIPGEQHDGHKFISDLYSKGVRSFIVSKKIDFNKYPDAAFFLVENPVTALQELAAFKRNNYKKPVIAITGSNGKTIVKEWLYWILSPYFRITRSPKSYNSQTGVPLSLWLLDDDSDIAIIEAGISQPGEMELLEKIIKPDIGIITNIGAAHQINFDSLKQKSAEKMQLLKNCKTVVLNNDCEYVWTQRSLLSNVEKILTWSETQNADIFLKKAIFADAFTDLTIQFANNYYNLKIPFTDKGSVQNALSCFAILVALNIEIDEKYLNRFNSLPGVKMRLETIDGIHNSIIINDSYNSDINSLEIALDYLNQKKANKESVLVMSDIHQSNEKETDLIKSVAKIVKDKKINHFIGIGEVLTRNKNQFPNGSVFYENTNSFLEKSGLSIFYDKAVLLKGARDFKFEKISKRLQQKSHLSVVETDLTLMRQNLLYFKSLLKPGTKMMVMVKAFSYGSGYREIAAFLQHNRIDYLAVAFTDEGTELRQNGIETPIMVMNPNVQSLQTMIEYKLEPEIYSVSLLKELVKELRHSNVTDFPIHIKLDTGMHRLGIVPEDIEDLCKLIKESGKIRISSIFSHLSGSDNAGLDSFTQEQVISFGEMYNEIVKLSGYSPDRHILNSAGILRFPDYHFEMVRLGIGLYGLIPALCDKLVPVSTFKSVISQIHKVKKGDTISYNRSGKIKVDSLIATVPVGYADGFDRRLGNGNWSFIVNGIKVPVIGDICMDMCMIDISGIDANEGDEVIIFGPQNTINEMSDILKTIPYEVITGISQRVKRVYFED